MRRVLLLLALLSMLLPVAGGLGTASAQEDEEARARLEALEQQLEAGRARAERLAEEAAALQAEVEALRAESREAANAVLRLESDLTTRELVIAVHAVAEARSRQRLEEEQARLVQSLAALQRLGRLPPEAALSAPGEPLDALRAALLLGRAVPELEDRAQRFADLHARYAQARARAAEERDRLVEQAAALQREHERLDALMARRQEVLGGTALARDEAQSRMNVMAEEADDLRQLIDRLKAEAERERERRAEEARLAAEAAARAAELREAARREAERAREDRARQAEAEAAAQAAADAEAEAAERQEAATAALPSERPENARDFPAEPAAVLQMPAQGRIALRFGQEDAERAEAVSQGLLIETRPSAQVVAPFDGRVAYAGRFRRYGLILIIEHDGRYHSLLAGLGRLAAVTGQWVLAGEPVGSMAAEGSRSPELYLELRRGGEPVDPLPWLAVSGDKARG